MPNYNQLILTGADYKLFLKINGGGNYPLLTVESINMNIVIGEELIYAVGEQDAIGNKQNERSVKGKINLQVGEMNAILLIEGLQDSTRIVGATLAAIAIQGGFARTFKAVNINTESIDIKAKDKQSIVGMDFTALTNV